MATTPRDRPPAVPAGPGHWLEVLAAFLRLGLTSFGGPVAHLGYFRDEFVIRRRWLDDRGYADLVALCQFLPGPASSQVGIAIGLLRARYAGALAAWIGFTLPSAIAMILFGYGVGALGDTAGSGWLHGLKVAAVAVVAQAVLGMARTLAPDRPRATLAIVAAIVMLALPSVWGQIGAIVVGGVAGMTLFRGDAEIAPDALPVHVGRPVGTALLVPVLRSPDRIAAAGIGDAVARARGVRCVLSRGFPGLRRRPRGAAVVTGVSGSARLGRQRGVSCRLWRRASGAGAAVHLRRLSRHRDGTAAEWVGWEG